MGSEPGAIEVRLSIPLPDTQIFRYKAMEDILELLVHNPYHGFSNSQLRELTGHGGESVKRALELLGRLDLIETRQEGKRHRITLNLRKIDMPDNPLLKIQQEAFRRPLHEFRSRLQTAAGSNLVGVVVFGSVAKGTADRTSDIDVLVIVKDNPTETRRKITDITSDLAETRFEGERYEFHVLTESMKSAKNRGEGVREILSTGVVIHETPVFHTLKEEILGGK